MRKKLFCFLAEQIKLRLVGNIYVYKFAGLMLFTGGKKHLTVDVGCIGLASAEVVLYVRIVPFYEYA